MRILIYRIRARIKVLFYQAMKKITKKKMIIDVTGTLLTPGNGGRDCRGNGAYRNRRGKFVECCCDECNYMICCLEEYGAETCEDCTDAECPRAKNRNSFGL